MINVLEKLDTSILFFLNRFTAQSPIFDTIILFFSEYLAYVICFIFLWAILFSRINIKRKAITLSAVVLASLFARFGITELIRVFYHRPRPFLSHNISAILSEYSYSFPSGHAAFFFAFSFMVYMYNKKLGLIFIILTVLMCVARIMAGVHYLSDIVGGLLVGCISVIIISWIHRKLFI